MSEVTVTVRGITHKGRNRVREHGATWRIYKVTPHDVALESVLTGYLKWCDDDFEIHPEDLEKVAELRALMGEGT